MMSESPFQSAEYRKIQKDHLRRTLAFLLENGVEFSLTARIGYLDFDPELPEEIRRGLAPLSLFALSGYTFESCTVDEEALFFEAGFGRENVGAYVRVPLLAIVQVFVGEYPVAVNLAEPVSERELPDVGHSMDALLNNPENRRLLKKKKKKRPEN